MKIGDKVKKNPAAWLPSEFDSWGRGVGVGVVLVVEDVRVDVRWPGGRCWEIISGLVKVGEETNRTCGE